MNIHVSDFERVFNRNTAIQGRGGGKGGGSNDANTLASRTNARMIEVISEGPIVGIIGGKKGIYFDKTPVVSEREYENFPNVTVEEHKGYPDDTPFVGHNSIESTATVETQVTVKNGPVVRTITDSNVNAVRVIVKIPGLVFQNDDGELKRTSVAYAFDTRRSGGQWEEAFRYEERNQKTMSAFQRAHRINLPEGGAPWDIRMRRLTADSEKDELANDTYFDSYVTLIEGRFSYPHTACVAMSMNAEDLGSELPARYYKVKGRIISVPSNYDPEARTYKGVWDGTFKQAWTNNPAWVFHDIVTHDRYGLGEFVKPEIVDKWSLYTIAQYCDQLVPSGFKYPDGSDIMEPRFTFNGVINSREEAFYVLQDITRSWRGMAYWAIGTVFATADMPTDPVKIVSPANVIGGDFEYQSTAMKARHSVVLVKWNNPDNMYQPETEAVIDTELLHKYDWREKSLTLLGCTSRGLAHRYGKWIIDSEQNETETISYAASWDHANVRPGEVIAVSDPHKAKIRSAGRIAAIDGNVVTLDAEFEQLAGSTYYLLVTTPSGKIEKRLIRSWENNLTPVLDSEFDEDIQPEAMWQITGTDIVPRQYRVLTVEEEEENIFRITALQHDPQKFDRIEKGIVFEPLPYHRNDNEVIPPEALLVKEQGYISNGVAVHKLTLSWSPPQNQLARGYYIVADTPENTRITLGYTSDTSIDLLNSTSGEYLFQVQTVGMTGVLSRPSDVTFWAAGPEGFARPSVQNLQTKEGGNEFLGRDLSMVWENHWPKSSNPTAASGAPSELHSPYYLNNEVRVFRSDDGVLLRKAQVVGTEYTYTYSANEADNLRLGYTGAERKIRVEVVCNDTIGRTSNPAVATFTNLAPPAIAPEVFVNGNEAYLHYPTNLAGDFAGVLVWARTESGYDVLTTAPTYDGSNNPVTLVLKYDTGYFCRIAAYDAFGKEGLNYSTEFALTTMTDGVDIDPPTVPSGLKVTSSIKDDRTMMVVSWDAVDADDLLAYDLQIKQGNGNWISIQCHEPVWEGEVISGVTYHVQVRARDKNANSSGYSPVVTHEAVRDEIAPSVPAALKITPGLTSLWLNWIQPEDSDFSHVEIWEDTKSDFSTAVNIAITADNSFARTGLGNEELRYYRICAVDTSGNKSGFTPSVSATTAEMPIPVSLTPIGLLFEADEELNIVSWKKFSMIYNTGRVSTTKELNAGQATFTSAPVIIYYVPGENLLRSTTNIPSIYINEGKPIAVYRGGMDVQLTNGQVIINGDSIAAGTIGAEQIATNDAVITNTAQIANAIIDDAKIVDLDAKKIKADTVLADSIVVGEKGESLKSIKDKANDPAAQINRASTTIDPGKVLISGSNTLASLLYGGDNTLIEGGKIAANTINANSLVIGMRGIEITGVVFEHNKPANNQIAWTSGVIEYTDNDGVAKSATIAAGSAVWSVGTLYVYWNINDARFFATTSYATANASGRVILATYRGGQLINANYGRTVIEGGEIKAQTITADQVAADAIEARHIKTDALEARHIKANQILAEHLTSNSITSEKINAKSIKGEHISAERIDARVLVQNGTLITDLIAAYAVSDLTAVTGTGNISAGFNSIAGGRRVVQFGGNFSSRDRGVSISLYRNGVYLLDAPGMQISQVHTMGGDGQSSTTYYYGFRSSIFVDTGGSHSDTYEVRVSSYQGSVGTFLQITSFKR